MSLNPCLCGKYQASISGVNSATPVVTFSLQATSRYFVLHHIIGCVGLLATKGELLLIYGLLIKREKMTAN